MPIRLGDFFSPEAGQARTAWLNDKLQGAYDTAQYYLGPTGIPDRAIAMGNALQFTDAGDMPEAARASRNLVQNPSLESAVDYATAGLAMGLPFVGARMMNQGVDVVGDALKSGVDDVRTFGVDEYGGIGRTPREEAFIKYLSSRTFDSEDEARKTLGYFLRKWNTEADIFGNPPKETLPDDIIDRMLVRRGGGFGVSQKGQNTRPEFIASPDPIGNAPGALWDGQDMQDYRKTAKPNEKVSEAFVSTESLPKAKLAGGRTGYDWSELERAREIPPVTIRQNPNGSVSIIDGNHRIQWARDKGFDSIPAYILSKYGLAGMAMGGAAAYDAATGEAMAAPPPRLNDGIRVGN